MKYKLSDLIDTEKSQRLLDNYSEAMGIASAVIDLEGNVLVCSKWQKICKDFHRAGAASRKRCIESDTVLANELISGKRFSFYRCRNGLTDAASPIVIEGEHVANAFIGQFLVSKPDEGFFRRQAAELGFNESSYMDALSRVPIISEGILPSVLAFLASFAEIVAAMALKQLKQMEAEDELRKVRDGLDSCVGERTAELMRANQWLCKEIDSRKLTERHIKASNTVLRLMTEASDRKEYLDGMVALIRNWTRCGCVGIRVLDEQGNIPYAAQAGFEKSFLDRENWLSLINDNCTCTRVIKGEPHSVDYCCMTKAGSFYSSDTAKLVEALSEEELMEFRGECVRSGFLSVAVVPIRDKGGVIGAIHLSDHRGRRIFQSDVEFLESLSGLIGEGIVKFNMKDALKRHNDTEEAVNKVFQLSLKEIEIETLLSHALDTGLSIPWLSFVAAGAIFVVDKDPALMILKAQRGLSEEVSRKLGRIPAWELFEQKASAEAYSNPFECKKTPRSFLKIADWPGSCLLVPIKLSDRVLGAMAFFFDKGLGQYAGAEEFMNAMAASLAGIIKRRELEDTLRKRETLLNTVLDNLPVGIEVVDAQGRLMRSNPAARLIRVGTADAGAYKGAEYECGFGNGKESMQAYECEVARAVRNGEVSLNKMFNIPALDGKQKSVLHSAIPIRDFRGDVSAAISVIQDISDQKKAEEELTIYMKRLERNNKDLQEFAFVASHDLREPLRKIQTFGRRISQKYGDTLGEHGRDNLMRIVGAAIRMEELLEGLLHYSQVTTHGNPFDSTDLNRVVRDTLSDMEIAIDRSGGSIDVGVLPEIEADEPQMRRLFQNLIGNGIKYQPAGGTPLIKIFSKTECKTCRIYVEDNGIGFDEKKLDRIFAPFQRLHGRSSPYEGTGMGLAICRKIVERHNGAITARSSPGKGSTFIVTLPLRQSAKKA